MIRLASEVYNFIVGCSVFTIRNINALFLVCRALKMKLLSQEMVDDYDPALMFTIPRLAIVSGLLIFPEGPLCLDRTPNDMSEMFRPFRVS